MLKQIPSDKKGIPAEFEDGRQLVYVVPEPPHSTQKTIIFSQALTIDGTPTGDSDLGIDGSVTPSEFCIKADAKNDRYITRLSFIMGYGLSAQGWEFADSGAELTNGVKVSYFGSKGEEIVVGNPKKNSDFFRGSDATTSITNWEARGFAVLNDYGFFINLFLKDAAPPYGIKLDAGTDQKLCVTIRDDCTDADLFNCKIFGFERLE